MKETLFDTDAEKDCLKDDGIYANDTCHYYSVLKRLCIKVGFEEDDNGNTKSVYYENGCFTSNEASFFEDAKRGIYYDFEKQISIEVRSSLDPYMVFAYARDNLGTDFTLFLYLAILCGILALLAVLSMINYYCCVLKKNETPVNENPFVEM